MGPAESADQTSSVCSLLLDKLEASTSAKHPNHIAVHNARDAISQVAQDINEIKRRKDLGRQMYVHVQGH